MIEDRIEEFSGFRVLTFDPAKDLSAEPVAYRIGFDDYDESETKSLSDEVKALGDSPGAGAIPALVIGCWSYEGGGVDGIVAALAKQSEQLGGVRALFLGDITQEEQELSWIVQGDLSPLWSAFPQLETLVVRGSEKLSLGKLSLERLKSLTIQCGGLGKNVLAEIAASHLPCLEHLELWLGEDDYGWNGSIADLIPFKESAFLPNLTSLGLCNSEITDEIAAAFAEAPVLSRLDEFSLSLGTLSDVGAEALLASSLVPDLKRLNLEHHYMSDAVMERMRQLGIDVNVDQQESPEDDDERYVAFGE